MKSAILTLSLAAFVAACQHTAAPVPVPQAAPDPVQVEAAIVPVLMDLTLPDVGQLDEPTATAVAACIVGQASPTELATLAAEAPRRSADGLRTLAAVLGRPETNDCVSAAIGA